MSGRKYGNEENGTLVGWLVWMKNEDRKREREERQRERRFLVLLWEMEEKHMMHGNIIWFASSMAQIGDDCRWPDAVMKLLLYVSLIWCRFYVCWDWCVKWDVVFVSLHSRHQLMGSHSEKQRFYWTDPLLYPSWCCLVGLLFGAVVYDENDRGCRWWLWLWRGGGVAGWEGMAW